MGDGGRLPLPGTGCQEQGLSKPEMCRGRRGGMTGDSGSLCPCTQQQGPGEGGERGDKPSTTVSPARLSQADAALHRAVTWSSRNEKWLVPPLHSPPRPGCQGQGPSVPGTSMAREGQSRTLSLSPRRTSKYTGGACPHLLPHASPMLVRNSMKQSLLVRQLHGK